MLLPFSHVCRVIAIAGGSLGEQQIVSREHVWLQHYLNDRLSFAGPLSWSTTFGGLSHIAWSTTMPLGFARGWSIFVVGGLLWSVD